MIVGFDALAIDDEQFASPRSRTITGRRVSQLSFKSDDTQQVWKKDSILEKS